MSTQANEDLQKFREETQQLLARTENNDPVGPDNTFADQFYPNLHFDSQGFARSTSATSEIATTNDPSLIPAETSMARDATKRGVDAPDAIDNTPVSCATSQ